MSNKKNVVVVGDGWSALGAVGFLLNQSENSKIHWLSGTKTRPLAPLATLDSPEGVEAWQALAAKFDIDLDPAQEGIYLREFKNKSFRIPSWLRDLKEIRDSSQNPELWKPETSFILEREARFAETLAEIEDKIRKAVLASPKKVLVRKEGVPVEGFKGDLVVLGSGEEIPCDLLVYADSWDPVNVTPLFPKPFAFLKKREPIGALQASFIHKTSIGLGLKENFFSALHREAGEKLDRHVWGYFTSDGLRSIWTICLTPEEMEDNHAIAKKLRKMKTSLDRMFEATGLIPPEKGKFADTVLDEQVRFEEEFLFSEGDPVIEPIAPAHTSGVYFLTDAYGPGRAMRQARGILHRPI